MDPNILLAAIKNTYNEILNRDPNQQEYRNNYFRIVQRRLTIDQLKSQLNRSNEKKNQILQQKIQQRKEALLSTPIIGSMTTIPKRLLEIKETIDSLKNQTVKLSKLILAIPHKLSRTGEEYVIPQELFEDPFIHIHRCNDNGPITKLLGALEVITDPNTVFITFDDDIRYPPDTIQNLLTGYLVNENAVYCASAVLFKYLRDESSRGNPQFQKIVFTQQQNSGPTQILEGWGGTLYRRSFFNNADLKFLLPTSKHCFLSDDLMISNYLAKNKIPIIKLKRPKLHVRGTAQYNALFKGADGMSLTTFPRYELAIEELKAEGRFFIKSNL